MDKKTIIIIVFCVILILFWGKIAEYLGIVKPVPQQTQVQQPITDTIIIDTLTPSLPVVDTAKQAIVAIMPIDSSVPKKTIRVSTPLYEMSFTNYGGGINSIILRNYQYQGNGNVILAENSDKVVPNIESLEGKFTSDRLVFKCDESDFEIRTGESTRTIRFVYDNGKGGRIVKSYTINPDRYDIGFDVAIEGIESLGLERDYKLVWDITPPPSEKNLDDDYGYFKVVTMMDKHAELADFKDGRMQEDIPGRTLWAGVRTKYFAAIMIPRSRDGEGAVARGTEQKKLIAGKSVKVRDLAAAVTMSIPSYGAVSDSFTLYAGPIHYKTLKSYNIGLEELTSLGWVIIKPFSIAIIWLLPKIYSFIPNYGVVVLIFALLIKVIIYPLTRKQTIAMTKLKDLQPRMKKLQERYKTDPAKLNKEMMKLYKEAGANPLSGCLPLLPQMPLFFALFTVFRTTIEFRGASFVGWITDLSVKDPYYILPIIMTVTMFIQQKMTMTDPKNKMLVYMMPLLFGWLFMNFPSGLVLYWTGFNILSLLETIFIRNRMLEEPAVVVEEDKE